ncbi:DUF2298 domain-containing protein [Chloroflexota bacterium]
MSKPTTATERSRPDVAVVLGVLLATLLIGSAFRSYNINWDEGTYHIHPDERHTTMVITAIQWPETIGQYLDTSHSPLNPRNANSVFFYGTLPLFLTKGVATFLGQTGYDEIHLVGRALSTLFDLASVALLYFVARRLFDWRVGLLSSFLLALTVLNIQGSHYFTVDTFLTFFVLLTIWFTLDVAEEGSWPSFIALGVSMGLTLSCKVSVFLLAVVVALGAWIRIRRRIARGRDPGRTGLAAFGGLVLAAVVALGVFRLAQPYAWAGPNYDGWESVPEPWGERFSAFQQIPEPVRAIAMPNPQWVADILSAGAQQTGEADMPWGRQWTERTPWLYPLENMVLWGMGVPLGLAAWAGAALVSIQVVQNWYRRRRAGSATAALPNWDLIIVPLAWVLLTFIWQGMQFVKSIRYFLPIYPFLVSFASYLVVSAWDWSRTRRVWAKILAGGLAAFVLVGTVAWAFAFSQIYREPVTRVQATRWMYENIETGATLNYLTSHGDSGKLQLATPASHIYALNDDWLVTPFTPPDDLIATDVVMNNLTGLERSAEGVFQVVITDQAFADTPLTDARIDSVFGGEGGRSHTLDIPDVALAGGQTYYLQTRPLSGAPLVSQGSTIANEHFDDPLPFNIDGRIAFGSGPYHGLDLALYDEDTPAKLERLLDVLDATDYISMSSGRLHTSIPRLPMRYPITTRYYELLFADKLGFVKAAEFHSYPRLFGIEFNDDRAEEQFTVYDHPKVLIYHKTADYERERVRDLLTEDIDWGGIATWLNPKDVPQWRRDNARQLREQGQQQDVQAAKNELKLTEAERKIQEQGGTWASLFDRKSLPNRWPTISWLVLIGVLGLAALPLTTAVLQWLPDRGYILARTVAILLLAWLSWILTSITPLHYSRGTILLALGLIALASTGSLLIPGQRRRFVELWRTRWGLILVNELLFLVFFGLFLLIRSGNPDLWHAWKGGEKPMDFAYLNAVIKSTEFPPYDPWFSGGYLNYYYFGQVMVGTLIKLIGIVPAVAYNLVIPLWFSLTATGAFSVTYNLVKASEGPEAPGRHPLGPGIALRPMVFGFMGAMFVAVLGNLGELALLMEKLGEGVLPSFNSAIPGVAPLVKAAVGAFQVVFDGRSLPIPLDQWYWNASRAIPAGPYESVITEFPFFTFLYSDLHAHLIALPLSLLSLAIALAIVRRGGRSRWKSYLGSFGLLLLWALTIGAMRTTNTWDVPPHLILALGALIISAYAYHRRAENSVWRQVGSVVVQFGILFLLSWRLLYWPFWANYGSFYNQISVWSGTRTPIWAYMVVHGLFLFIIVSYMCVRVFGREPGLGSDPLLRRMGLTIRHWNNLGRLRHAAQLAGVRHLPVGNLVWLGLAALLCIEVLLLVPGLTSFTQPNQEALATGEFGYRGLALLALAIPLGLLALHLLFRRGIASVERLWTYIVLLGLAMTLGVEVIVISGDIGRMNTVFKFYLQVWLMWGVAATAALAWILPRLRRWRHGRTVWLTILAGLILVAGVYPPLATSAKLRDRFDPGIGAGLDGWAYMGVAEYYDPQGAKYDLKWDLEAMNWLLDNVVGSPVILEGHTPEYRWGGRYSINTGLPTVLGWNWHQRQQRAAASDREVWNRADDVATMYNTRIHAETEALLHQYNVEYIIVGPLEQVYYRPEGLNKFEWMDAEGMLETVFENEGVTIYRVAW